MPQKIGQVFWIIMVDTYILIISFALVKLVELVLKSFWASEIRLLRLMDFGLTLPILFAYIFLLSFDLSEFLHRNQ